MKNRATTQIIFLVTLGGCCSHWIDPRAEPADSENIAVSPLRFSKILCETIRWIILLAPLAGCCSHWVDIRAFRASSLAEQIPEFERAYREHCIPRESLGLLITGMASHGMEAAAAMIEILKNPNSGFPQGDAIEVLEALYEQGIDLRDPETLRLLSSIETTSPSRVVRARAKDALWRMRTYAPGELQRPEIDGHPIH
jgi:hypothetical protein